MKNAQRSPIPNPQSPIPNPQSPIPNPQTRETPATVARVPHFLFGSIYSEKLRGDAAERLLQLQLSMGITSL